MEISEGKFVEICAESVVDYIERKGYVQINVITLSDFCIMLKEKLFHEVEKSESVRH